MVPALSPAEIRACQKLIGALNKFKELNPDMPLQQAMTLLAVATAPQDASSNQDIQKRLDIAQSTLACSLSALSSRTNLADGGKGSLGLIRMFENPMDARLKVWTLTPTGKAFIQNLVKTFEH